MCPGHFRSSLETNDLLMFSLWFAADLKTTQNVTIIVSLIASLSVIVCEILKLGKAILEQY